MGTIVGSILNPLSLTPALWIDFSDAGTVTVNAGNVETVNDKSGNGINFTQGTGSKRPSYQTAVLNGLNIARFDGTDDELLVGSTNLMRNVTGATIYVLRKWAASPTTGRISFKISNNAGLGRAQIQGGNVSGKDALGGRTLDADAFVRVDSAANVSTATFQIQTGVYDIANTDLYQYINATLDGSTTSYHSATTTSNTASSTSSIGSAATTGFFNGDIAEILVYHSAHNAATRQRVWSYLRQKWGI